MPLCLCCCTWFSLSYGHVQKIMFWLYFNWSKNTSRTAFSYRVVSCLCNVMEVHSELTCLLKMSSVSRFGLLVMNRLLKIIVDVYSTSYIRSPNHKNNFSRSQINIFETTVGSPLKNVCKFLKHLIKSVFLRLPWQGFQVWTSYHHWGVHKKQISKLDILFHSQLQSDPKGIAFFPWIRHKNQIK